MKVSFIVPVYKVEQYLTQCVESILAQTYSDFEILLVDDGSPDGCPALCDSLAVDDDRVKVIHKENGGLSDARNAGLNSATGDFVVFVDGDDFWISKDDLASLMKILELKNDADFIGYNCKYYYPETNTFTPWVEYDNSLNDSVDKNKAIIALVQSGTVPMSACLKIFRRSFLVNNELFFKKGQIAEDIPWFINLLDKTEKCCFVNHFIYAYRQNVVGSITNTSGRRGFDSLFDIFKTELEKIDGRSFNENAKKALKSFLAYEYCILLTYLSSFDKEERLLLRKELYHYKDILQYTLNPKVRKASVVYKFLGIRATEIVLNIYQYKRKQKK